MKMVGSSAKRKNDESNIDLTPMLDVVFILLIFFVVTASFNKDSALSIQGQDPDTNSNPPPPDAPKNVLIQITGNDLIVFNQERIDIAAVPARIAQQRAENPSASVIVQPDPESTANALVTVMNYAKQVGVTTVSVIE